MVISMFISIVVMYVHVVASAGLPTVMIAPGVEVFQVISDESKFLLGTSISDESLKNSMFKISSLSSSMISSSSGSSSDIYFSSSSSLYYLFNESQLIKLDK